MTVTDVNKKNLMGCCRNRPRTASWVTTVNKFRISMSSHRNIGKGSSRIRTRCQTAVLSSSRPRYRQSIDQLENESPIKSHFCEYLSIMSIVNLENIDAPYQTGIHFLLACRFFCRTTGLWNLHSKIPYRLLPDHGKPGSI